MGAMEQVYLDEDKSSDNTDFGPDMNIVSDLMLYAKLRLDIVVSKHYKTLSALYSDSVS